MFRVITTVGHATPRHFRKPTIWEALADKLGREPTRAEAADEVRRIMADCTIAAAPMRRRMPRQGIVNAYKPETA